MARQKSFIIYFFLWLIGPVFSLSADQNADINGALTQRPHLTVWIRAYGEQAAQHTIPYLHELNEELSAYFQLKFLLCTQRKDPLLKVIPHVQSTVPIEVVQAEMLSHSQVLNSLIKHTKESQYVLSASVGAKIKPAHLIHAIGWLDEGAWVYGWKIASLGNDGSQPGKGWYNTAALYSPKCLHWMKHNAFPKWIDNGVEGTLKVGDDVVPIGGDEEIVLMGLAIQHDPKIFFVLNTKETIEYNEKTGTGVSYESKLERRVPVARYYLEKKLHQAPSQIWRHLFIIREDDTVLNGALNLQIPLACRQFTQQTKDKFARVLAKW